MTTVVRTRILKVVGIVLGSAAGLVLAALAIYVILYYPRTAEPFEITTPDPDRRVLVATQGSDFKNALSRALCDSLKHSPVYIKGIDVGDLAEVNDDDWDRILIVNSFVIWLNKDVDRFLARAHVPEKILVYITSGGADWMPQPEFAVDALTSASRKVYISHLIQLITDWIDRESDQKWTPDDYVLALNYSPHVDVEAACLAIELERERYKTLHPNLVGLINRAGYQYLRLKSVPSALEVLRLNVSLFPDHWNVYDSYGEALLASGDRASAIRNYRKALELNPDSESAGRMLKKLGVE